MKIVSGHGTLLRRATVLVAQRVKIDGPDLQVPVIDKTNLDSTRREKRPGLPDAGNLQLNIQYDPTAHATLLTDWKTPARLGIAWELEFNDGSTGPTVAGTVWAFTGFLTGFKPTGEEVDSNLVADISIEITGDITQTLTAAVDT